MAYTSAVALGLSSTTTLDNIPEDKVCLLDLCRDFVRDANAPAKILVVGCGVGLSKKILDLAGLAFDYTGIDICENLIDVARKEFANSGEFFTHDGEELPYDDAFFDIVVLEGSLQHAAGWEKMLEEACRISKSRVLVQRVTLVDDRETLYFSRIIKGSYIREVAINERQLISIVRSRNYLLSDIVLHKRRRISDAIIIHFKTLCFDNVSISRSR